MWGKAEQLKETFNWELELPIRILILHGVAGNEFLQQGHVCKGGTESLASKSSLETVNRGYESFAAAGCQDPTEMQAAQVGYGEEYGTGWEGTGSLF